MALHHSPTDRNLMRFVAVSLAVHLVTLIVWGIVSSSQPKRINLDLVVKTRLIKLGKKRDEKLLPKIAKKPAQKRPDKVKKPEPKKPADVKPKKVEPKKAKEPEIKVPAPKSANDILNAFNDDNTEPEPRPDLNKMIKDLAEDDEGNPEGSNVGKEITGKLKADYNDKVKALVRAKLTAPQTLTDADRMRLRTTLAIRIGRDGKLLSSTISSSSGNNLFDNASLRAAKTAHFPPPPIAVRDFYARGISFNVCPVRCN